MRSVIVAHRIANGSESRAQRSIIISDFFSPLPPPPPDSRQFRARDKSLTLTWCCNFVYLYRLKREREARVMYLTAAHTLYLLIESWLFTAPDLFACTRKNGKPRRVIEFPAAVTGDILQSYPVVYSRRRQRIPRKLFRDSVARYIYATFVTRARRVFSAIILL